MLSIHLTCFSLFKSDLTKDFSLISLISLDVIVAFDNPKLSAGVQTGSFWC